MSEEKAEQRSSVISSTDSNRKPGSALSLKNLTVEPSPRSTTRIIESQNGEETPTPISLKPKFSIMNSLKAKRNGRNNQKNLTSFDLKDKTFEHSQSMTPENNQERLNGDLLNLSNYDGSSNREITHQTEEHEPSKNFSFFIENFEKVKGYYENSDESPGISSKNLGGKFRENFEIFNQYAFNKF